MNRLTRIEGLAAAMLVALAVNGCAPIRVNSYLERGVDFRQYRTYAWGPSECAFHRRPSPRQQPVLQRARREGGRPATGIEGIREDGVTSARMS